MKLSELLKGETILASSATLETEITEICTDSRKADKGCLFLCIDGVSVDGHKFIPEVQKKGAIAILIDKPEYVGENTILVKNTRTALSRIAANLYGHPADSMHLIGVTGTNGKTTVTLLLKQLLEQAGHKVGLIGTIQNMIGKQVVESAYTTPEPLSLHRLFADMKAAGCDYVIMEVSSHSLAQHRVDGLHFDVGVFTNLTQDHLDFHRTMENYLLAKAKLFTMCDVAILNYDDAATEKLLELSTAKEKVTYSAMSDAADIVAKNIELKADGVKFNLVAKNLIGRIKLGIPGRFSVYNALAVAAAALQCGIDLTKISVILAEAKGVKGRAEVVPTGRPYTILIDYAHTPDGLYNILSTVKGFAEGRVIAVFGCGGDRDHTKRPKMGKIAAENADFLVITSDNPRTEEPEAIIKDILGGLQGLKIPHVTLPNRTDAIRYAMKHAKSGDVIVLAGKGHETYQILKEGKIHYDEREVIAEILAEQNDQKTD